MFRNKKSEILWGLKPKAYMYGSKIVKRQDGSVQFTILWCHQNGNPVFGWPSKTTKLVVPNLPSHFEKRGIVVNLTAILKLSQQAQSF